MKPHATRHKSLKSHESRSNSVSVRSCLQGQQTHRIASYTGSWCAPGDLHCQNHKGLSPGRRDVKRALVRLGEWYLASVGMALVVRCGCHMVGLPIDTRHPGDNHEKPSRSSGISWPKLTTTMNPRAYRECFFFLFFFFFFFIPLL